ncbi:DNA topoisomerase family protein [[Haemophilus] ducreyi]|uniref:DNA topoisomerase family protein n=1 Tax=Haemophilus ducreyi TaxID=730 RepID=UPI000654FC65|nr:topoisomerase DNA-binding C4 zinc finger domain-containing protein [[Haemophilus] ducreyi]AKO44993.1 hypothetical protein RZ66_01510 [[Haemophilus] ducreyi]AKO46396.1 hypothetical protein RZ67_01495 [[Haemophilus] ducreyi]AKO47741.1 hypothetical protein RZ68_01505 [[Haemophilus] ducreyi]AKO49123.1 hypothetical protein RZ69_01500 [[Haemophilus] ducreyi]ANF62183.1 hypothetical protein A6037_05385 [[Haemophilus] ducreyi]
MSLFTSTKHAEVCPDCGAELKLKRGKQGLFWGCTGYPACRYIRPLQQMYQVIKVLAESCPVCGYALQLKQGQFGIFIGCSHYPQCTFTVRNEIDSDHAIFDCPACNKHKLVARKSRLGKPFYGCSGFPECKFTLPSEPIAKICPKCHSKLAIVKKQRGKMCYLCINKGCQHLFSEENE